MGGRGVMDHMARSEQAEAMKGGQRSITGARALSLTMATEGHTRILLRRVEVVIFIFVFLTVGIHQGEILV
jgi:hypothetical protein